MAFEIRRGQLDERRRWNYKKLWTGKRLQITCPNCGRLILLSTLDRVEDDGTIRTPLICTYESCDFLETNARLVGWDPKQLE